MTSHSFRVAVRVSVWWLWNWEACSLDSISRSGASLSLPWSHTNTRSVHFLFDLARPLCQGNWIRTSALPRLIQTQSAQFQYRCQFHTDSQVREWGQSCILNHWKYRHQTMCQCNRNNWVSIVSIVGILVLVEPCRKCRGMSKSVQKLFIRMLSFL